jgi:flagellar assembly protein FliH
MPEVERYLFDTSFDAPPRAPEPEPVLEEIFTEPLPPPPPTFSESELVAARAQARAEGLADGLKRGRAEAEADYENGVGRVLLSLSAQVVDLLTEQAARIEQNRQMAMEIALTLARKLLPDYASRFGFSEIEAVVCKVMDSLHHEPRLVVRVAEAQLDAVTARVQQEAGRRGFDGKLVFLADAALGPADCRVEWAEGGIERDMTRIWNEIDRLVADVVKGVGAVTSPL